MWKIALKEVLDEILGALGTGAKLTIHIDLETGKGRVSGSPSTAFPEPPFLDIGKK